MIKALIEKRNEICQKADNKELEIQKAQKLLDRYKERTRWIPSLLIPIAKAIMEKEGFFKFQTMGPFGLTCSTSLWFWKTEEDFLIYSDRDHPAHEKWAKNLVSITFRPQGYYDENDKYRMGLAVVKDGEDSGEYPEGSIGYLNGFHKKQIDIDEWDLDTLIAYMYEQNSSK